jgi:hypothetical protein
MTNLLLRESLPSMKINVKLNKKERILEKLGAHF